MLWRVQKYFTPPVDVIELPDKVLIVVEIAGMHSEDFNISLMHHRLVISGVRRRPAYDMAAHHRVEIGFGEFRMDIPIPWTVEPDMVTANYDNGFLQVTLPRRPERQIPVTTRVELTSEENGQTHD